MGRKRMQRESKGDIVERIFPEGVPDDIVVTPELAEDLVDRVKQLIAGGLPEGTPEDPALSEEARNFVHSF